MKLNRVIPFAPAATLALSAALCAGYAGAADTAPRVPNAKFEKLDVNRDGFLSRDEVRQIRDYGTAFTQADDNKDGRLDADEFIKAEAIHDRIVAGKYVDDGAVTAKVKAALLKEPGLDSLDVSVETDRGRVLLSGFVKSDDQRRRAVKVAGAVAGAGAVKDSLVVR